MEIRTYDLHYDENAIIHPDNESLVRFEQCLMDIFNCQEEKPNLKNLALFFGYEQTNLPLSLIYHFVDGNSYLKSLSLLELNDEMTTIKDLLLILRCNHELEKILLGGRRFCVEDCPKHPVLGRINSDWEYIHREKFPDLIKELNNIHNAKLMDPDFSCKDLYT